VLVALGEHLSQNHALGDRYGQSAFLPNYLWLAIIIAGRIVPCSVKSAEDLISDRADARTVFKSSSSSQVVIKLGSAQEDYYSCGDQDRQAPHKQ